MTQNAPPLLRPRALERGVIVAQAASAVRRATLPDPDHPDTVMCVCASCGVRFPRRRNGRSTRCPACAFVVQLEVATQVAAKDGPHYVAQVEAAYQHYARERRRLRALERSRLTA